MLINLLNSWFILVFVQPFTVANFSLNTNITFSERMRRIIDGQTETINRLPYLVSLSAFGIRHCAGVLISQDTVLTTMACAMPGPLNLQVRIGSTEITASTQQGNEVEVEDVVLNCPEDKAMTANLALLLLKNKLSKAKTIEITFNEIAANAKCIIAGYGQTSLNVRSAYKLHIAKVSILQGDDCIDLNKQRKLEFVYCSHKTHACPTDIGGPLVCNEKLVGIISEAICGANNATTYLTKLAMYKNFIKYRKPVCSCVSMKLHGSVCFKLFLLNLILCKIVHFIVTSLNI